MLIENHIIRKAGLTEHAAILELWQRSVKATHHFLTSQDIAKLYQGLKNEWLSQVALFVLEVDDEIVGFIGSDGNKIEMLFIDDIHRGKGYGERLIHFMKNQYPCILLDANEQNQQAVRFYKKQGFCIIGRSELDSQGNPFPLLHMSYP